MTTTILRKLLVRCMSLSLLVFVINSNVQAQNSEAEIVTGFTKPEAWYAVCAALPEQNAFSAFDPQAGTARSEWIEYSTPKEKRRIKFDFLFSNGLLHVSIASTATKSDLVSGWKGNTSDKTDSLQLKDLARNIRFIGDNPDRLKAAKDLFYTNTDHLTDLFLSALGAEPLSNWSVLARGVKGEMHNLKLLKLEENINPHYSGFKYHTVWELIADNDTQIEKLQGYPIRLVCYCYSEDVNLKAGVVIEFLPVHLKALRISGDGRFEVVATQ